MTLRNKLFTVLSSLTLVFAVSTFALAQDSTIKQDDSQKVTKEGKGHRGGKHGKFGRKGDRKGFKKHGFGRGGEMRGFHKLNLTDDQKAQMKAMHENFRATNEGSRKEMFTLMGQKRDKSITADGEARLKDLMAQSKLQREQLHTSSLNILTAEQRTQLETMKAERKQKMEERRQKWQERKAARDAAAPVKSN